MNLLEALRYLSQFIYHLRSILPKDETQIAYLGENKEVWIGQDLREAMDKVKEFVDIELDNYE